MVEVLRAAPSQAVVAVNGRPPRRREDAIPRARVREALTAATTHGLTVVTAPVGCGKTTALDEWARHTTLPVARLPLGPPDRDPRRLWARLLAALRRLLGEAVMPAVRALHDGADLAGRVVPLAVNALERHADDVAIVIDDYHHVDAEAAHRSLIALLDAAPEHLHLVIAGRTRPPLRLSRRLAAGAAVEIDAEALAFRPEEARALLNGHLRLGLDAAQLAMVDARVRGWPAGLALVAQALAEGADRRDVPRALRRADALIDEHVGAEVLDRVAPGVRRLLVETAAVRRFTASLGQALTELPETPALLEEARRHNLLTPDLETGLDGDWYRCHALLAGPLRRRLEALGPDVLAELHGRASRWFERAGRPEEAIEHASRAGDGPRAARLLHASATELLAGGRYDVACRLIRRIPRPRGEYAAFAEAAETFALQLKGAEPAMVHRRWEALRGRRDEPGMAMIVDYGRAWPFFGRVAEAVEAGRRAYAHRDPGSEDAWHAVAGQLGLALWFAGEVTEARWVLERHLDAITFPNSKAWALSALALCAADEGDADRAVLLAARATGVAARYGGRASLQFSIAHQARAGALRQAGRHDDAEAALAQAHRVTGCHPTSLHHALTLILEAELHLARHARAEARRVARQARPVLGRYPDVGVLDRRLETIERMLDRGASDELAGSRPTAAEQRILKLLAAGLTTPRIAEELFLSMNTVKTHRRKLYRRLGVDNRADAIAVARRRGLV